MPVVDIKGVGKAQFPDNMDINNIREFLRNKYYQDAVSAPSLPVRGNVAAPVETSLADKAGQAVADFLFDKGIITDRYRAQETGRALSGLAEFLPGIGDATAGDDTGRALAEGRYGDAALSSLGTVPVLGDMAIFAGALAKNADLGMLKKAKLMEDTGANRDEIWKETGWFNDKGDWKFEISDQGAMLTGKGLDEEAYTTTGGALMHNRLYENYPDTSEIDMSLTSKDTGGKYIPYMDRGADEFPQFEEIGVDRSLMPERRSTALHELQHAIQQRENFARGGSPHIALEVVEELRNKLNAPLTAKIRKIQNSKEFEQLVDKYQKDGDRLRKARAKAETDLGIEALEAQQMENAKYIDRVSRADKGYSTDPFKVYQRLAGEAEARLVQKRMNMTPEERRARPPWQDLDVPEDELIYRKDSTTAQSVAGDAAKGVLRKLPDYEELTLFHGTNKDFDNFDVEAVGEFSSADTFGNISMTPFFDEAESYSRGGKGGSPRVIKSDFKGRVKVVDDLEEHDAYEMMDIEEKAREQGFDAVYYSGIQDSSFYNPMGSTDTVKVLNPKSITQTNKNFTKDDYRKDKFMSLSNKGKYSDDELKDLLKINDADINRYRKGKH